MKDSNKLLEVSMGISSGNGTRKYYVYRLIDPRNYQTFYVGKGCGDRVFQHVRNVQSLINGVNGDEDALSLKSKQIADILSEGKEVITVIHRRGLTEKEAFEVEAALIDAYPGLTNIQKGHGFDQGLITVEDLYDYLNASVYSEPSEKYVIIKTSVAAINERSSLYEATRRSWKANLAKAKKYPYVLSVVNGIVREVYKVDKWYQYDNDRIAFEGEPTSDPISSLKKHRLPEKYRQKGASYPFLYKKP